MVSIMENPNSNPDPSFPQSNSTDTLTLVSDFRVRASSPTNPDEFKPGDMVWGKVKSHPWWPGHVFNESFASSSVRKTKSGSRLLVAFFGDSSYGWFDPAELIPYEPHFAVRSKQTNQKNFVKAVVESIDEMSRRAALGVTCRCRNPYNFRETLVKDYYEVDVVGYERNGIYSKAQITKEREGFDVKKVLGFLNNVAATGIGGEGSKDGDWYRKLAVGLALRRARFEEFDETYAQAFGQVPVWPERDERGVLLDERFAPRVAPLRGSLVIAEALGSKKKKAIIKLSSTVSPSASRAHKGKDKIVNKKKDKYVLDKNPSVIINSSLSIPDASFSNSTKNDFVMQKREALEEIKLDNDKKTNEVQPQTPPLINNGEKVAVKKEKKIKKRPLDDNSNQEAKLIRKKKKKLDAETIITSSSSSSSHTNSIVPFRVPSPSLNIDLSQPELPSILSDLGSLALDPFYGAERNAPSITRHVFLRFRSLVFSKSSVLPEIDAQAQEDVQFIKRNIASSSANDKPKKLKRSDDPTISGKKRSSSDRQEEKPKKKFKVTKTKSLAVEKKPATSSASTASASENKAIISSASTASASEKKAIISSTSTFGASEKKASTSASEKKAIISSASTSSSSVTKVSTSIASASDAIQKKAGTSSAAASKASGKKTAIAFAASTSSAAMSSPAVVEPLVKKPVIKPVKNKEPPPPLPKIPTYLIMKFPLQAKLPSVPHLKAQFVRFGNIDGDKTRVYWGSHSCKVLFLDKKDAVRAYSSVRTHNPFGPLKVNYSISEVELPAAPAPVPEPQPEPLNHQLPVNGGGNVPLVLPRPIPLGAPKSILKKPGSDEAKSQRVKFALADNASNNNNANSPPKSPPLRSNVSFDPCGSFLPPSPPPLRSNVSFDPRGNFLPPSPPPLSSSFLPPSPPPLSSNVSFDPRISFLQPSPPPLMQAPYVRIGESQQPWVQHVQVARVAKPMNVDISHQFISCLLKVNDIVSGLKNLPGHVPCRPL